MKNQFLEAIKSRRSIYGFSGEEPVSIERIEEIVRETLLYTPSSYNSQSTRILVLFHEHHKRLWQLTLAELQKVTPPEKFPNTQKKINESFASGYATILYFEDQTVVNGLVNAFPLYADKFPVWSQHTNAMHQFVIWTALETEGLGASLQHYNPIIDEDVRAEWGIPSNWKLIAQMPVGKPMAQPAEKEFLNLEPRIKVFK